MCRYDVKAQNLTEKFLDKPVELSFPAEFIHAFPPDSVMPQCCLICKRYLSHKEMFPSEGPPRYMCSRCFDMAAYDSPKEFCLLWGKPLPHDQIQKRQTNPEELEYALCPNECEDYWIILAGKVLGIQFNFNHSMPATPPGVLIMLPCSSEPEPAIILPRFNDYAKTSQRGLFAEYRFKMIGSRKKLKTK
jgi:hypothetical protein